MSGGWGSKGYAKLKNMLRIKQAEFSENLENIELREKCLHSYQKKGLNMKQILLSSSCIREPVWCVVCGSVWWCVVVCGSVW